MGWFEQEIFGSDIDLDVIYNEDCRDTMRRIPDDSIHLTVTSPPYDNLRSYEGYDFPFEHIAEELYRITSKDGIVVWVVGDATIGGGGKRARRFVKRCISWSLVLNCMTP